MSELTARVEELEQQVAAETAAVRTMISGSPTGDVSALVTAAENLVGAVNELEAAMLDIDDAATSTTTTWSSTKIQQVIDDAIAAISAVAPFITGSIPDLSVEQDTVIPDLDLTTVFDRGVPAGTFSLVAPAAGVSVSGTSLLRSSTNIVDVSFTVRCANTAGSVELTSQLTVTAASTAPATLTVNAFSADSLVFDSGGAFGNSSHTFTFTGTADGPGTFPVRVVEHVGGAAASLEVSVNVMGAGAWAGIVTVNKNAAWLRVEAQQADGTWVTMPGGERFAVGHVVVYLGQSELDRVFITGGGNYGGTVTAEQTQLVKGVATYASGSPGSDTTAMTITRDFVEQVAHSPKFQHAGDVIQKNTTDKVMCVDATTSGSGLFQLTDDATDRRRWTDFEALLDEAGWQDGVRPGALIMMWTNAAGEFATDYMKLYRPVFTGRSEDGSDYILGTSYTVETFPGTPGTNDETVKHDHILFDLTTLGRGKFDRTQTKVFLCHHRYDALVDLDNFILRNGSPRLVDTNVWGQEIIRETYAKMLADPDFSQVMVRGTEPMNYENGTLVATVWGDWIHPGQGVDGLQLFSRHLAHAALTAVGVVPDVQPTFDQATFDPGGTKVNIGWSGGDITTTRKIRGVADLDNTYDHWTDVFGFEFNDVVVQRAEIQPDGTVDVFVPPGAGSGVGGIADWAKDRFFFGRGGGGGAIRAQDDPKNGGWLNYPVADAAPLGVQGMYDDQTDTAGGLAFRPRPPVAVLAAPAYISAAVTVEGTGFRDPLSIFSAAGEVNAESLRVELRCSTSSSQHTLNLVTVGTRFVCDVNRSNQVGVSFWAGGQSTDTDDNLWRPGVRYDVVVVADMVANSCTVDLNGTQIINHVIAGSQDRFVNGDFINILQQPTNLSATYELEYARVWINDPTGAGTPHKELLASAGAAAIGADPWRVSGGTIT